MNQRELEYALAKQVPDMARGFTINTSYGDIVIEAGMASLVAKHLEQLLREYLQEWQDYDQVKADRDRHGFSREASLIGENYPPHPTSAPTAVACSAHCDAPQCAQAECLPPAAMPPTPGSHQ